MANANDAVLWAMLGEEILLAMAEDRLPAPALVPTFARETVRPAKVRS